MSRVFTSCVCDVGQVAQLGSLAVVRRPSQPSRHMAGRRPHRQARCSNLQQATPLSPPPTCVCTTLEDPQHSQITLHPQKPGTVTIKKNIKTLLNRRCRSSASLYPYFQCSVGPSKLLLAILPCLFLLFNYLPVVIIYGFFSSHRKVTLKAKLLSSSKSHRHNINYFQRSIKIEDITRH